MKVRDYKSLLTTDPRTAMLFDLTERFPRGPDAKLRAHDYRDADGRILSNGWGSNVAPYLNRGVTTAQGSNMTGGWDPYEIFELPDNEWNVESILNGLIVDKDMAMGDGYYCEEGKAKLFKNGAQLTRRSRRAANRIRRAKDWVKANITVALYSVNFSGWGGADSCVFVHADNEQGALKQWELFMKSAFNEHCDNYREDRVQVEYVRPAKTPLELMSLNAPMQAAYRASIEKKRATIERLQKEIEAMDTAEQIVNIYAINMVATWGTGEGENADA
tara:strand:+ start:1532 stop:2356 length:825 start_codon:yes stop_codon:yes gene_type:complete